VGWIRFLLRAHACVSRAHVCAGRGGGTDGGLGGRASGEDYVYVGKEGGGWLEPRKVEVRAALREWEGREGRRGGPARGKERKIDLPRARSSDTRFIHSAPPASLFVSHFPLGRARSRPSRRGAPKRDADNRVNRRTCGVAARVNIFVTSPL